MELAKAALLSSNYEDAVIAAERANDILDNWKLRVALKGLRTAPGLLQKSYKVYEQILVARYRSRAARNSKRLALSNPVSAANRLPA
jgi:hypothetical protein